MKIPRLVVVAVTALTVLGTWMSPAQAAEAYKADKAGEVRAAKDIRQFGVSNGPETLSLAISVANLDRGPYVGGFSFHTRPMIIEDVDWGFQIRARLTADGRKPASLWVSEPDGFYRVKCRVRAVWKPRADFMGVSLPQACLQGWEGRVQAQAFLAFNLHDKVDWSPWLAAAFD